MNDRAREALVAAALNGTPQIRGALRDQKDGRCALGVLCEAAGFFMPAGVNIIDTEDILESWAECSLQEATEIVRANDALRWDFLTIARKIGVKDEGN